MVEVDPNAQRMNLGRPGRFFHYQASLEVCFDGARTVADLAKSEAAKRTPLSTSLYRSGSSNCGMRSLEDYPISTSGRHGSWNHNLSSDVDYLAELRNEWYSAMSKKGRQVGSRATPSTFPDSKECVWTQVRSIFVVETHLQMCRRYILGTDGPRDKQSRANLGCSVDFCECSLGELQMAFWCCTLPRCSRCGKTTSACAYCR
ncbi:hypothetical protein SISSUDRAFT_712578 [Sistotremastrum suecicum HHB10207 ss-3]|uniref:Uncharacterized protein n=1 Tax=Sistotremastrum suecicum HHB10207 ss-3 TaxID=1314776 RepID=A0A166DSM2_9AGAM|nr:hypothetical protein SISSUDRAFT_712578 [Sistotremastrum suecicum HHB10207 ss-3]